MKTVSFNGKNYEVDSEGFLIEYDGWDKNFAEGMAPEVNIPKGLTDKHYKVLYYIRDTFEKTGVCPLVFQTCKSNGLLSKDLKALFPDGYLRGACKLAGITYKERLINYFGEQGRGPRATDDTEKERNKTAEKVYRINVQGFLVDPSEWDPDFAIYRALDMKIEGGLNEGHFKIINFLRETFAKDGVVPNLYETCEANGIELDELENLFPDGYHRGAVKLAGLHVR